MCLFSMLNGSNGVSALGVHIPQCCPAGYMAAARDELPWLRACASMLWELVFISQLQALRFPGAGTEVKVNEKLFCNLT